MKGYKIFDKSNGTMRPSKARQRFCKSCGKPFAPIRKEYECPECAKGRKTGRIKKNMRAESFKESLSRRCKIEPGQLTGETPEECIVQAKEIMSEREMQGERETIEIRAVRKWVDTMDKYAKNGYRII